MIVFLIAYSLLFEVVLCYPRDDIVQRRGYTGSDHFVTTCLYVCVWLGGCVSTIKRKPLIAMT